MVKAVGFNCCKVSLVSTSIQYLNTMIIYMVIIINVFIFLTTHSIIIWVTNSYNVLIYYKIQE